MKRKKHTVEQIIAKLWAGEMEFAGGILRFARLPAESHGGSKMSIPVDPIRERAGFVTGTTT